MWTATLMAASLFAGEAAATAGQQGAQAAASEPIVQIGLFGYTFDGRVSAAAYDTEPSLESTVYSSDRPCRMGAGNREAPAYADHAWRFAAHVIAKTPEEATLQLRWQRVVEDRRTAAAAEQSMQLTIRAGERVTLDSIVPAPGCSTGSHVFEARYMSPRAGSMGAGRTSQGSGGVGGASYRPSGGSAGQASGSGAGTGAGSGAGGGVAAGGGAGAGAGAGVGTGAGAGAGARAGEGRSTVHHEYWPATGVAPPGHGLLMSADLWLVHRTPGREDRVQTLVLRAARDGADFSFEPIPVTTPTGTAMVQVGGSFSVSGNELIFVTNRRVTQPQGKAGDRGDTQGRGRSTSVLPAVGEVVSFELPPIGTLPDRFDVRFRIVR